MEIVAVSANNDNIDLAAFTKVVGAFLVAGSDAATAAVFDYLTQSGSTAKFTLKAAAASMSPYLDFGKPGIPFKTAISVTLTGTSPILYLVVE